MFCNKCGTKNSDDAEFCNHCGAKLVGEGIIDEKLTSKTQIAASESIDETTKPTEQKILLPGESIFDKGLDTLKKWYGYIFIFCILICVGTVLALLGQALSSGLIFLLDIILVFAVVCYIFFIKPPDNLPIKNMTWLQIWARILIGVIVIIIIFFAIIFLASFISSSYQTQHASVETPSPTPIQTLPISVTTQPVYSYATPVIPSTTNPVQRDGKVTITSNEDSILIGQPISFSGICIQGDTIGLSVTGPGLPSNGELLASGPCQSNAWSYQWSTAYSLQPGSYRVVVVDVQQNSYDYTTFTAQQGTVTIVSNKYSYHVGDPMIFSGTDTSGHNVELTWVSPSGTIIGSTTVNSDHTWSYQTTLTSVPYAATYTVWARDTISNQEATVQIYLQPY